MTTNQHLERKIADLESDIQTLMRVLAEISIKAQDADFGPSPVLEQTPAYLLGVIQSMAKFAPMKTRTALLSDMFDLLVSLRQPA
jgi:hypothetical protein